MGRKIDILYYSATGNTETVVAEIVEISHKNLLVGLSNCEDAATEKFTNKHINRTVIIKAKRPIEKFHNVVGDYRRKASY